MHDDPPEITPVQRAELTTSLRAIEQRLLGALDRGADGTKPVDLDEPIGRLSRMDALAQREMNEAGRRTQAAELAQVRRALEAIAADEYGLCRACDEPIAFARLKARPFATVCIRCQSQREQRR